MGARRGPGNLLGTAGRRRPVLGPRRIPAFRIDRQQHRCPLRSHGSSASCARYFLPFPVLVDTRPRKPIAPASSCALAIQAPCAMKHPGGDTPKAAVLNGRRPQVMRSISFSPWLVRDQWGRSASRCREIPKAVAACQCVVRARAGTPDAQGWGHDRTATLLPPHWPGRATAMGRCLPRGPRGHPYKQRLTEVQTENTLVTRGCSETPMRVIRNPYGRGEPRRHPAVRRPGGRLRPHRRVRLHESKAGVSRSGARLHALRQGAGAVTSVQSCAEIIDAVMREGRETSGPRAA